MNMKVMAALAACIFAVGCDDPPSCETAIRRSMKRLESKMPSDATIATVVGLCTEQKWSGAKRSCLASATSSEAAARCLRDDAAPASTGGRRTEAEVFLNSMGKAAAAEFATNGQYPVATAPLTPATPCCQQPNQKCQPVQSDWVSVPAWDALGFEMTRPFSFQYSYTSDGKTFHATAVGDLDCDGVTVTYTLDGSAPNGSPTSSLTKPTNPD